VWTSVQGYWPFTRSLFSVRTHEEPGKKKEKKGKGKPPKEKEKRTGSEAESTAVLARLGPED
jgi:hypothetical protein